MLHWIKIDRLAKAKQYEVYPRLVKNCEDLIEELEDGDGEQLVEVLARIEVTIKLLTNNMNIKSEIADLVNDKLHREYRRFENEKGV